MKRVVAMLMMLVIIVMMAMVIVTMMAVVVIMMMSQVLTRWGGHALRGPCDLRNEQTNTGQCEGALV